jgi:hypothetical protein
VLLGRLLDQAGVDAEEAAAIQALDARDKATLAVRKLGATPLPRALRSILTQRRYGLAHALLAALPISQSVTTNYDGLFETARRDQGRPVSVPAVRGPAAGVAAQGARGSRPRRGHRPDPRRLPPVR